MEELLQISQCIKYYNNTNIFPIKIITSIFHRHRNVPGKRNKKKLSEKCCLKWYKVLNILIGKLEVYNCLFQSV